MQKRGEGWGLYHARDRGYISRLSMNLERLAALKVAELGRMGMTLEAIVSRRYFFNSKRVSWPTVFPCNSIAWN